MNAKILLTMLLALTLIFCVSAIHASDVNITDDATLTSSDDMALEIENVDDADSVNSNTLSTNTEETSLTNGTKNQTEVTSSTSSIYYDGSFSVTLKDLNTGHVIANKTINFIINDANYTAVSNNDGVASLYLSLKPGIYTATAYFAGDDNYLASNNITSQIQVLTTINASSITKYYKGSANYNATFYDTQGDVLANTTVVITVNGKTYYVKTNNEGVAYLSINLSPGSYKVVATNPVSGYKLTTTFKILSTISGSKVSKVIGDSKKFTAKFLKSDGTPLANTYVKFKLKGKTYKVKTNSNGFATLSLKNLKKGSYKVICYNKDGLSKSYNVKIYKRVSTKFTTHSYTFFKSDDKKIKFTLSNSLGYAPTSGKLIKISINGKYYYKRTNSKGEVEFKLPNLKKGCYKIKYKFGGTNHYKASSASSKVSVITTNQTTLAVKSTKTFGYGAGTPLKVAVSAAGVPVIKKKVIFEINNQTYAATTDTSGIASLKINFAIGNYTVNCSFADSRFNLKSSAFKINVKERTKTAVNWKSGDSFTDASQTFKILLKDINGKAISGQKIKLTINSKTYTKTTSAKGYATFKLDAPIGNYKVSVKFAGSNSYIASSTSKSVSITFSSYIKGVNEKNTIKDLSAYLKSSSHCQVGNSKIKSLVKTLTKGLTSDYDKAKAIFNYVRDTLSYSFYYNTKHGAVGTLNAKSGNCVDHSHLLVAMFRTAGLAARYVHGTCRFSSGSIYGHVWAQVLVGDVWVSADATSSRNSLGKIVNWNTKSYGYKSSYSSLPF